VAVKRQAARREASIETHDGGGGQRRDGATRPDGGDRHVPAPVAPAGPDRAWPEAPAGPGGAWPLAPAAAGADASAPAGTPPGGACPGRPFDLPGADWTWPFALAGLALGAAPEALIYAAALIAGTSSGGGGKVTTGSAAALAAGSLVLYGWQTLAAWIFSLRTAGTRLRLWGFRRPTKAYFWVVPVGLATVYVVSVGHDIVVHPKQQELISEFPHNSVGVGLFVLVAVIMAPLFEEVIFRGFLFRGFANSWGWLWGALASGAIFGLAHLQLDVFLPLATLGFVLAWAYKRTGSLWTCITMHALFNLIAVVAWALTG
jgi:membrane protease YdiL (CAAX protease family)